MVPWIILSLCLIVTLVVSNEECGDYVPGGDPVTQPYTFCSPKPFNWNCSSIMPGSTWHYLRGYVRLGRCCQPVYGMNGTFQMCRTNFETDTLKNCGEGFHNWNSPFSSMDKPSPIHHAEAVCKPQTPLTDSDIPRVVWKHIEFITRNGKSVTLLAKMDSSTKVVISSLFRQNNSFPVMSTTNTFHSDQDVYVAFTLNNVTATDEGLYYVVVTNTKASGWSDIARLRVLRDPNSDTHQTASGSSATRCMLMFVSMICMLPYFINRGGFVLFA